MESFKIVSDKDVLTAPNLVFICLDSNKLCCASPTSVSGSKWCYDTKECPTKTHAKADKVSVKPGLYVNAGGNGKSAFTDPHVQLKYVLGRDYAQELLELSVPLMIGS